MTASNSKTDAKTSASSQSSVMTALTSSAAATYTINNIEALAKTISQLSIPLADYKTDADSRFHGRDFLTSH